MLRRTMWRNRSACEFSEDEKEMLKEIVLESDPRP